MSVKIDLVLLNARLTTKQDRCHRIIQNSTIACVNGNIFWVGPDDKLPNIPVEEEIDSEGRWVTPSLIDCHTHLVYDG
jgi:imidazolonepropionase|tara:strand:+ start:2324 stop:2557 length:234 start_codon:yes stop_codon:yes gene_type:complete